MTFKNIKKRLKNYGLWVALVAFLAILLDITPENLAIIDKALGVLVALGIFSNPTTNTSGFGDDK